MAIDRRAGNRVTITHLHVHDDFILWNEQALERLAGGCVKVVESRGAVVNNHRQAGLLRLHGARAVMMWVHPTASEHTISSFVTAHSNQSQALL